MKLSLSSNLMFAHMKRLIKLKKEDKNIQFPSQSDSFHENKMSFNENRLKSLTRTKRQFKAANESFSSNFNTF